MHQTALETTQLGKTGVQITRMGFGASAIGGAGREFGWGSHDDDQVDLIFLAASLEPTETEVAEIDGGSR